MDPQRSLPVPVRVVAVQRSPQEAYPLAAAEYCDRLKQEFEYLYRQHESDRIEIRNLLSEKVELQRHVQPYHERICQLEIELHRMVEGNRRLVAMLTSVMSSLPHETRTRLGEEIERTKVQFLSSTEPVERRNSAPASLAQRQQAEAPRSGIVLANIPSPAAGAAGVRLTRAAAVPTGFTPSDGSGASGKRPAPGTGRSVSTPKASGAASPAASEHRSTPSAAAAAAAADRDRDSDPIDSAATLLQLAEDVVHRKRPRTSADSDGVSDAKDADSQVRSRPRGADETGAPAPVATGEGGDGDGNRKRSPVVAAAGSQGPSPPPSPSARTMSAAPSGPASPMAGTAVTVATSTWNHTATATATGTMASATATVTFTSAVSTVHAEADPSVRTDRDWDRDARDREGTDRDRDRELTSSEEWRTPPASVRQSPQRSSSAHPSPPPRSASASLISSITHPQISQPASAPSALGPPPTPPLFGADLDKYADLDRHKHRSRHAPAPLLRSTSTGSTRTYSARSSREHTPQQTFPRACQAVKQLPHGDVICAVSLNASASHAYTGGKGSVKIWDVKSSSSKAAADLRCLDDHYIRSCKLSPDAATLICAGETNSIAIWDLASPSPEVRGTITSECGAFYALAMSPYPNTFFACSSEGVVQLWDYSTLKLVRTFKGHTDGVSCIDVSPDETKILTGALDNTVRVWDIASGSEVACYSFNANIFSVGVCPGESWIAVGLENSVVEVLNLAENNCKYQMHLHDSAVLSLNFAHSGKWFVTTGKDKLLNAWKSPTVELGACIFQTRENNPILCSTISNDDSILVTGSAGRVANVYELLY